MRQDTHIEVNISHMLLRIT